MRCNRRRHRSSHKIENSKEETNLQHTKHKPNKQISNEIQIIMSSPEEAAAAIEQQKEAKKVLAKKIIEARCKEEFESSDFANNDSPNQNDNHFGAFG